MRKRNNPFNFFLFIIGILILSNCTHDEESSLHNDRDEIAPYLEVSIQEWENALDKIGYELNKSSKTVVLVTGSSHCRSCLEELEIWNSDFVSQEGTEILLVVVEKFEKRYLNFLNKNNLRITSVRDENGLLFSQELIPFLPAKVLISEQGNIERIHSIGGDRYLANFLEDISDIRVEVQRR